jgi:hypothetical protein
MTTTKTVQKGPRMEEILREYFLEMGYYVVRGTKYRHRSVDVTDVDLWLYQRASLFSRQRLIVDVKNRRIPQALERVLWSKGLQACLELDGTIVATTDSRDEVKNFAQMHGVITLDGRFLAKLKNRYQSSSARLPDEELFSLIRSSKSDRLGVEWLDRLTSAKSRVLSDLNFDGCNALLADARYFTEQVTAVSHRAEVAARLLYATISLFLISLDFVSLDFAFEEKQDQLKRLTEGLRFGKGGARGAKKIFALASDLVAAYGGNRARQREFADLWTEQTEQLPVEIIAEFAIKAGQGRALFDLARSLESVAYSREFVSPSALGADHRAALGAALDFFGMNRKEFFEVAAQPSTKIVGREKQSTVAAGPEEVAPRSEDTSPARSD